MGLVCAFYTRICVLTHELFLVVVVTVVAASKPVILVG